MARPIVEGHFIHHVTDMNMQQLAKELLSRKDTRVGTDLEDRAVTASKAEFHPWASE